MLKMKNVNGVNIYDLTNNWEITPDEKSRLTDKMNFGLYPNGYPWEDPYLLAFSYLYENQYIQNAFKGEKVSKISGVVDLIVKDAPYVYIEI